MSKKRDDSAETATPELPPGWCWTTLGELLDGIEAGKSFKCDPRKASQYEWGVIKVSAMTWGEFDEEENKVIPPSREIDPHHEIRSGDLLLSRSNTVELVGATVLVRSCRRQLVLSDKSMRLLVPPAINRGWLQKILSSPPARQQLSAVATGTSDSMRNVSQEKVLAVRLLLPPATEQTRILTRLEELLSGLDAGVAALKQTSAKLKRYRAAVLKAAVHGRLTAEWRAQHPATEPASKLLDRILAERRKRWEAEQEEKYKAAGKTPPKDWRAKYVEPSPPVTTDLPELLPGWCWSTVEQLTVRSEYGTSVKCDYFAEGPPVLRIPNIAAGMIDLEDLKFSTQALDLGADEALQFGDMLMCRTNGSVSLIGKAAVIRSDLLRPHTFASYLLRFRFADPVALSLWVHLFVSSRPGRRFIEVNAASSAGQHNISLSLIHRMPVPVAPTAEQTQIVSEVEERLSLISAAEQQLEANMKRATRLRQCILKRAFDGKLVPQDPKDEPASVLLDRIRATRRATSLERNGEVEDNTGRERTAGQVRRSRRTNRAAPGREP